MAWSLALKDPCNFDSLLHVNNCRSMLLTAWVESGGASTYSSSLLEGLRWEVVSGRGLSSLEDFLWEEEY